MNSYSAYTSRFARLLPGTKQVSVVVFCFSCNVLESIGAGDSILAGQTYHWSKAFYEETKINIKKKKIKKKAKAQSLLIVMKKVKVSLTKESGDVSGERLSLEMEK